MGAAGAAFKRRRVAAPAAPSRPVRRRRAARPHSTAFTMSSMTFLASPKTIIVLSM